MCSRASLIAGESQLKTLFDIEDAFEDVAKFNATPRTLLPVVILKDGKRAVEYMSWGITPSWDPYRPLCHVRSETALEKPTFKAWIKERRCLIPVLGFYEWQDKGKPFYFRVNDTELFVLAGTWQVGKNGPCEFVIVTVLSNDSIADCNDRMPVIVEKDNVDLWQGGPGMEPAPLILSSSTGSLSLGRGSEGWRSDEVTYKIAKVAYLLSISKSEVKRLLKPRILSHIRDEGTTMVTRYQLEAYLCQKRARKRLDQGRSGSPRN